MNRNDCKQVLFYAAEIFNERMGTTFNEENLVLSCFQTSNQEEVFEQFCKQYFPDRLTDRYKEEGYFDFHASAFIGEGKNSVDGILLRTDIERTPAMLYHILLHELAHVFCAHNELCGDSLRWTTTALLFLSERSAHFSGTTRKSWKMVIEKEESA